MFEELQRAGGTVGMSRYNELGHVDALRKGVEMLALAAGGYEGFVGVDGLHGGNGGCDFGVSEGELLDIELWGRHGGFVG